MDDATLTAKELQTALKKAGLYDGRIDGIFGPKSQVARANALKAAGVDIAAWSPARRNRGLHQWALKQAGFDPGPIDGVLGPRTFAAHSAYREMSKGPSSGLVKGTGRNIKRIVIHCTATREGQDIDAATIRRWHLNRGWSDIGYHYVIRLNGHIETGRPESRVGSHVSGFNTGSIGVVYVGGLDAQGKPKDTRTAEQVSSLKELVTDLLGAYPRAEVFGHRDLSPDLDGDGKIEKHEWLKACPSFNAREWWASVQAT